MIKTFQYPFKIKRTFFTTHFLSADSDLFARIEKLRASLEAKNTVAQKENLKLEKAESDIKSMQDKITAQITKSQDEKENMLTYINHFKKVMSKEEQEKADKILSDSNKMEELFNKKISNEEGKEISLVKLIKLQSTKEKLIHDAEDKVENMINKSVEKRISDKELDMPFQQGYLAARTIRLTERSKFKDEEKKVYSESASRLSPIDHVVEQMETAEPDYSDMDE